jgi:hypothetical protein
MTTRLGELQDVQPARPGVGTGDVKLTFRGSKVTYSGSARITGGSGAFSRMRGRGLRLTGGRDMTGSRFRLRLTRFVSS